MKFQIFHRYDSAKVLYECELPDDIPSGMCARAALEKATAAQANLSGAELSGANLSGANLRGAYLSDANLSGAELSGVRTDFWEILLRAPREIAGLRAALVDGKVNGSTYEGLCACLVGTIANVRGTASYKELGNGLKPNSSRPAERWFLAIKRGDTPETNQISKITVEWLDEFVGLLAATQVPA